MRKILVASLLFALSGFTALVSAQQSRTSCKVGTEAPAFGFWTWPQNATIKVSILSTDFKKDEHPFLLAPLTKWNAASNLSETGVTFEYVGEVTAPLYCENCLTIMRGPVYDKTRRHATELKAYSARNDHIMTWGHIVIDPALTNPEALTDAVAHELGHNLGLLDCYSCKQKSTVMGQFKDLNIPNGMEGPTTCDVMQVRAAFKQLGLRAAPQQKVSVDEGEEPVDDDTPVILKKP